MTKFLKTTLAAFLCTGALMSVAGAQGMSGMSGMDGMSGN